MLVVGAGLAGLTAATTASLCGARVTLVDARREIGGRARSEALRGFTVNEGAHALYRAGTARAVLGELRIRPRGKVPRQRGGAWFVDDQLIPWRRTSAVGGTASVLRAARALLSPRSVRGAAGRSMAEWADEHVPSESRSLVEMLVRTTTYTADLASLDAVATLAQIRLGSKGVTYLHGGWRSIVDALRSTAGAAGVDLRSGRVSHVSDTSEGAIVTTSDGVVAKARALVLATGGPGQAHTLLDGASATISRWSDQARPVRAACLDVALATIPQRHRNSTYGLGEPLYLVNHAATARLAPDGGGVFHGLWYEPNLTPHIDPITRLETVMDAVQPNWRDHLVLDRPRRQMVVAHDRPRPGVPVAARPSEAVDDLASVFVAGDWIAGHGMLADAAIGSGRAAGRAAARSATSRRPGPIPRFTPGFERPIETAG